MHNEKITFMGRGDWIMKNIEKELDDSVNEKLKKDPKMKRLGIRTSQKFYEYHARKYVEED